MKEHIFGAIVGEILFPGDFLDAIHSKCTCMYVCILDLKNKRLSQELESKDKS